MKICPYCHKSIIKRSIITPPGRTICRYCDLVFRTIPVDKEKSIGQYRDHYFDRHSMDQFDGRRQKIFLHILGRLSENRIGKLLDVGTGCGFFLVEARKKGWQVKGIDLSRKSVEVGRYLHHLDIYEGSLHDYDQGDQFDAVTYINVLDHILEPWEDIKKAAFLLKDGGVLYLRFPNARYHAFLYKLLAGLKSDEFAARQMALGRLVLGLIRRCRRQVYLGISNLGEQGYEQRGPLLQAVQRTLRRTSSPARLGVGIE